MGIVIRQSIKSTIINYLGVLIGTFNVLWLMPRFLEPDKIGLLRLLQDIPFLLALLLQLGATNISDKYFFHFRDHTRKHNGFFFLLLVYPLAGFTLISIIFIIFDNAFDQTWQFLFKNSEMLLQYLNYVLPLTFIMMYSAVFESYLRVNLETVFQSFIREIYIRIVISLIIVLYVLNFYDLNGLIMAFTMGYAGATLLLVFYIERKKILFLRPDLSYLKKPLLKEIGKYLVFVIPGAAGSLIAQKIDNIMLGSIKDLNHVGVYSLAYFIGTIVEIPKRNIAQITSPLIAKAFKENNYTEINTLYKKTSLNQLIAGIIIFLLVWINVDDLLSLIPNPEKYEGGKYVILFIGLAKLVDMATGTNSEIILFSDHYRFNLVSLIIMAVLTVATNLIFIPLYGINGAAIAFLITLVVYNASKAIFIYSKMGYQPFSKEMIWPLFFGAAVFTLSFLLPYTPHTMLAAVSIIVVKCILAGGLYVLMVERLRISPEINDLIHLGITKGKIFLKHGK